jgi:hypothetical protein
VVETEDFKKTWKVVGSTGEYEFWLPVQVTVC